MTKWTLTSLKNCTTALGDGLHGTPEYSTSGEYVFINGNNLVNGRVKINSNTKRVSLSEYEKYKKPLSDRTILVSINGTLGNVAIYNGEKIILGKSVCYLNISESCNMQFIKYVLLSPHFRQYLSSVTTGTTIKNISLKQMRDYQFLIPDYAAQSRISSILSTIDNKIKINEQINHNLEQQCNALFKSWFIDFDPFGGVMPDDWKILTMDQIVKISSGKRPMINQKNKRCSDNVPIVGATSILGYTNDALYDDKILIIGRVGTHGIIQRFNSKCWPSDNTLVITSDYYEFIYNLLQHIDYSSLNRGSTQPLITQTDLRKIPIILPRSEYIDRFENLTGALMKRFEYNNVENCKLITIRDILLPKLMSGEIDVSNIKI